MISPFWQNAIISFITGGGFATVMGLVQYKMKRKDNAKDKKEAKADKTNEIAAMVRELISWKDDQATLSQKQSEMLLGLAHDRIVYLGSKYIERGSITMQELDDFSKYLYEPYTELGGNGTGKMIWERVNDLPAKS